MEKTMLKMFYESNPIEDSKELGATKTKKPRKDQNLLSLKKDLFKKIWRLEGELLMLMACMVQQRGHV
jgi:hypothetical protein